MNVLERDMLYFFCMHADSSTVFPVIIFYHENRLHQTFTSSSQVLRKLLESLIAHALLRNLFPEVSRGFLNTLPGQQSIVNSFLRAREEYPPASPPSPTLALASPFSASLGVSSLFSGGSSASCSGFATLALCLLHLNPRAGTVLFPCRTPQSTHAQGLANSNHPARFSSASYSTATQQQAARRVLTTRNHNLLPQL